MESFDITIAEENGVALASAAIIFKDGDGEVALTLSSGSTLTITDDTAGNWVITVEQIDTITLAAGFYSFVVKTVDAASLTKFYVAGNWEIK